MRIEEVIGHNVRSRREKLGMTQEDLGRKIGKILERDWPRQTVFTAEKGSRNFAARELLALAIALDTAVERLFRLPPDVESVELSDSYSVERASLRKLGSMVSDPLTHLNNMTTTVQMLNLTVAHRLKQLKNEAGLLQGLDDLLENAISDLSQRQHDQEEGEG